MQRRAVKSAQLQCMRFSFISLLFSFPFPPFPFPPVFLHPLLFPPFSSPLFSFSLSSRSILSVAAKRLPQIYLKGSGERRKLPQHGRGLKSFVCQMDK